MSKLTPEEERQKWWESLTRFQKRKVIRQSIKQQKKASQPSNNNLAAEQDHLVRFGHLPAHAACNAAGDCQKLPNHTRHMLTRQTRGYTRSQRRRLNNRQLEVKQPYVYAVAQVVVDKVPKLMPIISDGRKKWPLTDGEELPARSM